MNGFILAVVLGIAGFFGLAILISMIREVKTYEKGVFFSFGVYKKILNEGWHLVIPIIQSMATIDMRQRTIDMEPQDVMTKDQVNLTIDGVLFYAVEEADKVVLNVTDIRKQLEDKATSELKEIIGKKTLSESLSQREEIAKELMTRLNKAISDSDPKKSTKDWGVEIRAVQINNIELPKTLVRAMAKEGEAEREKLAIMIRSQGELEASENYKKASENYSKDSTSMRLRELKTYEEIGKEQNSLMIVIPEGMANSSGNWVIPMGQDMINKIASTQKKKVDKPS